MKIFLIVLLALTSVSAFSNAFTGTNLETMQDSRFETKDCGIIDGLSVSAQALKAYAKGYGSVEYWSRTFKIRRSMAEAMSKQLKTLSTKVISNELSFYLNHISKQLVSMEAIGYGNVLYWSTKTKIQDAVLINAGNGLSDLEIFCN